VEHEQKPGFVHHTQTADAGPWVMGLELDMSLDTNPAAFLDMPPAFSCSAARAGKFFSSNSKEGI
jgi:hypothetical protein